MDIMRIIRAGRGVLWFIIGTVMIISGTVYTIRALVSGADDEWYAGLIAIVIGIFVGGYMSLTLGLLAARKEGAAEPAPPVP